MASAIIATAGLGFLFKEKLLYQPCGSGGYNQVCYNLLCVHNITLKTGRQ